MPVLLNDLKHALRSLIRTPGFSLMVVLILALGIGLNSAMLAVFDRLVAHPLPLRDLDRLVAIYDADTRLGWTTNRVSSGNFLDYQRRATQFEALSIWRTGNAILGGDVETTRIPTAHVSSTFFPLLRVHPRLGRTFTPEEDRAEGPKVALLTHAFWVSRFGSDPGVVGRSLRMDGAPREIVGVLPASLRLESLLDAQVFLPMGFPSEAAADHGDHSYNALGRLRPGVTVAQADQELKRIARELATENPQTNKDGSATVTSLLEQATEGWKDLAFVLVALSALLLLIACANVSNLMLARGIQRQHDLAIRSALGATRKPLILGMLMESFLLGLAGAFGGILAGIGFLAFVQRSFLATRQLLGVTLDTWALCYGLGTTLVAITLSSLVPVWRLSRIQLADVMKEGQKGSHGLRQRNFQAALLVVQVALSMVLLTGSGVMIRSLWKLGQVTLGFRPGHLLAANLNLPPAKYRDTQNRLAFVNRLRERLRDMPGVLGSGIATFRPPRAAEGNAKCWIAGEAMLPGDQNITWTSFATPEFFATAEIPLRQGLIPLDPAPDACVVNEAFASLHGLGGDAVGRQVVMDSLGKGPNHVCTIVGVVGNVRNRGLARDYAPQIFGFLVPQARFARDFCTVYLKCEGDPWLQMAALKAAVREVEPDAALGSIETMDEWLKRSLQGRRTTTSLFIVFGSLGLLLAGVGLYGLMAYLVAQRTREIGIRAALGADPGRIVREIIRQGLLLTCLGLGAGFCGALILGRWFANQLYQVSSADPLAMAASALILVVVAFLAPLIPAQRAARIDPVQALRND